MLLIYNQKQRFDALQLSRSCLKPGHISGYMKRKNRIKKLKRGGNVKKRDPKLYHSI